MPELIVAPRQPLVETLRAVAATYAGGRARIAVAWAREEGVVRFLDAVGPHIPRLEVVVGLNEQGTTVEALLRLLQRAQAIFGFFKHPRQTFHHKLYYFDDGAANPQRATLIVGSSNLTRGGLLINFESSLIVNLGPADQAFIASTAAEWVALTVSPYASRIATTDQIRELYERGYLALERTVRRRQRESTRRAAPAAGLPTAPPPHVPPITMAPVEIPFALLPGDQQAPAPAETSDPAGTAPLPDRLFVRTLTANDVEKLHDRQVGTFEPDLGQTARDRFPAFWGWPDMYQEVVGRGLTRLEWKPSARLISSLTVAEGIPIVVTLWFRPERPGHAAEHRIGLGPIGDVRGAVPDAFDTESLMVVERAPQGNPYTFVVRLIAQSDPGYSDFASFLTEQRPQHRFGYGP